ncbi:N-carbamoyl-L-amino-acid hydrolase [Peribacillus simplex]|uniref:N-carbamoyl-L-amino-acid hydrolase n=1 Tax=Peribacillus simplex TaxID=1478 RepID=A0A9X8RDY6_9BACI|nr:M20 family metallo-hydrolase [Peribacillus simplex]SIS04405.1 N-carbamoyl-L-amino-acid hydrolase [Peribacillus simplex]
MDSKNRYQILFNKINQYNTGEKGITRIAYTNEEQTCTHAFMRMCKAENLDIRMDQCGNVIARREGRMKELPPVVMGSHLDTVYQGGKYDGVVGVTAALEVIKRLNEKRIVTDHPIEIISFACEESARFGVSTVGSKAMAGLIEKEKYRHLKDRDGITMEKAFSLCAFDLNNIDEASRVNEKFKAFFELHVEQGPVLKNNNKKIGIVTGIAAPVRFHVKIIGKASHSGTTPMNMRKDALLGAAEIIVAIEKAAKCELEYETVATVGVIDIHSGAMNVVPGEVEIKIDIRSTSIESRQRVVTHLFDTILLVIRQRQVEIVSEEISSEKPVLLSKELSISLENICKKKYLSYQFMQSGAGHDAMNMAKLCPVGLIFVPSEDGLSHHPNEFTELDDILNGIDVLEEAVLLYSKLV